MLLSQARGLVDERLDDLDGEIARPVLVQITKHTAVLTRRERPFVAASGKRRARLHVRQRGRRDHIRLVGSGSHRCSALLLYVELYEGAGIQVEPHPRSSITASAIGSPL